MLLAWGLVVLFDGHAITGFGNLGRDSFNPLGLKDSHLREPTVTAFSLSLQAPG
jgi:hypothetical protein